MGTKTLTSVADYLRMTFEDGDHEYVDGEVIPRNVGNKTHSRIQRDLVQALLRSIKRADVEVLPELRFQAQPTRYRIPDVGVWLEQDISDEVPSVPPLLAIEILSPEDRVARVIAKVQEYLAVGVDTVWVIDPPVRNAIVYSRSQPAGTVGVELTCEPLDLRIPIADVLPPV